MGLRYQIMGLKVGVLLITCLLLFGCHSRSENATPSIIFTKIPAAALGGPDKLDTIEGRVNGAHPGQQIVLYAKSEDLWWVQPFSEHPFTNIQTGSRWKSETHLGTEYAALLVDPGYKPPQTTEVLPVPGGPVIVAQVIKGQGPGPPTPPAKVLHFSGYDWIARNGGSYRGGSHNSFDPANAWTDEKGALHLRIVKHGFDWICAEVKLTRSLGYGTYVFEIRDTSHLEPSAVVTMSTSDGMGPENDRRELDIEISRWGNAKNDNAQYVIQPYYIPVNIVRFQEPAGKLTHSFRWQPGQAEFSTAVGSRDAGNTRIVSQHVFTSGVPTPGGDSVRLNLYTFGTGQVPLKNETEIVIDKFEYFP